MSDQVIEQAPLLGKVRDVLRAGGIRCEVGQPPAPAPGDQVPKPPYAIVYGIDGGDFYGTLDSPESCATQIVQVTYVAKTGRDAALVADKGRSILFGRLNGSYLTDLDSAGAAVGGRRAMGFGGMDGDSTHVSVPERYEFLVS